METGTGKTFLLTLKLFFEISKILGKKIYCFNSYSANSLKGTKSNFEDTKITSKVLYK